MCPLTTVKGLTGIVQRLHHATHVPISVGQPSLVCCMSIALGVAQLRCSQKVHLQGCSRDTPQRRAYMSGDKTWVKVLSEDLQRDTAARAHMREYAKKTLSAIKQVSWLRQ